MKRKLTPLARRLRNQSTNAERLFWSKVRAHRLDGYKFKRQQPIGVYIVDFVCAESKLIVELDGGQHASNQHDVIRDAWLRSQGFTVLRFWNTDVLANIDGVVVTVLAHLSPSRQPSPIEGEGVKKQIHLPSDLKQVSLPRPKAIPDPSGKRYLK